MRLVSAAAVLSAALVIAPAAEAFNPQIAGLQIALRKQGFYRGAIDGIQGTQTRRAIRTFQRRRGLQTDGLAGPRTRAALGRFGRPLFGTRVIRRGMIGYDVGVLQFLLRRRGLRPGRLDGRFGVRTERAVRHFQRRARLTPDGVVGPRTARRLCRVPACAWRAGVPQQVRVRPTQSFSVRAAIDYWSRFYGVDPQIVLGIAWFESGFNNTLVSSAGARGVMQVLPTTREYVETVLVGRAIPRTLSGNVRIGVAFLHQLLHEFRGDLRLALAAYVQGPRSVRTRGLFPATRLYVDGVLALSRRL